MRFDHANREAALHQEALQTQCPKTTQADSSSAGVADENLQAWFSGKRTLSSGKQTCHPPAAIMLQASAATAVAKMPVCNRDTTGLYGP